MNDWYAASDSPELVEFGRVRGRRTASGRRIACAGRTLVGRGRPAPADGSTLPVALAPVPPAARVGRAGTGGWGQAGDGADQRGAGSGGPVHRGLVRAGDAP